MEESGARDTERRCIVTGVSQPKEKLIRFVVGPEGAIVPDIRAKLPGRGIWVAAARATLDSAIKMRSFARAARAAVTVSPALADEVEALLAWQLRNALGLAYKAGAVSAGFAKAEAMLERRRALALFVARDAGPHGAAKLCGRAAATGVPVLRPLSAEEMGLALGRENMVHAALGTERLARRVLEDAQRLAGFRPDVSPRHDAPAPESEEI